MGLLLYCLWLSEVQRRRKEKDKLDFCKKSAGREVAEHVNVQRVAGQLKANAH